MTPSTWPEALAALDSALAELADLRTQVAALRHRLDLLSAQNYDLGARANRP